MPHPLYHTRSLGALRAPTSKRRRENPVPDVPDRRAGHPEHGRQVIEEQFPERFDFARSGEKFNLRVPVV